MMSLGDRSKAVCLWERQKCNYQADTQRCSYRQPFVCNLVMRNFLSRVEIGFKVAAEKFIQFSYNLMNLTSYSQLKAAEDFQENFAVFVNFQQSES